VSAFVLDLETQQILKDRNEIFEKVTGYVVSGAPKQQPKSFVSFQHLADFLK
jgi:hypothetical protein